MHVVIHESVPDLLGGRRWAILSPCGRYRYLLGHVWDARKGRLMWILLNPSTADHQADDPTMTRMLKRTKASGYGGLVVCNLFALRSPDPTSLRRCDDPVGPANDAIIRQALHDADDVLVGWGTHGRYRGRDRAMAETLTTSDRPVWCLGRTACGAPRHPLYVPYDQDVEPWP